MRLDLIASELLVELYETPTHQRQACAETALASVVQRERSRCAERVRSQMLKFSSNPILSECLREVMAEILEDLPPWTPRVIEGG